MPSSRPAACSELVKWSILKRRRPQKAFKRRNKVKKVGIHFRHWASSRRCFPPDMRTEACETWRSCCLRVSGAALFSLTASQGSRG